MGGKHPVKDGYCEFFINSDDKFFLVEGVWDALSINMAGYNAIVCFSAQGLLYCSLANFENWILKGYVYADNEESEVGINWGTKASMCLNTGVLKPILKETKDANDVLVKLGKNACGNK